MGKTPRLTCGHNSNWNAKGSPSKCCNLDIRRTVLGSVPLRGFIEGDFFSSDNEFRLRHAYITAGDFIVGQTWTTLSFLEAMPYMIDFAAGDAPFGGRAAQVRYQTPLNDRWKFSIALEELQFLGIQNANSLPGKATTQWPLLAFRADYRYDSGLLLMGGGIGHLNLIWRPNRNKHLSTGAEIM